MALGNAEQGGEQGEARGSARWLHDQNGSGGKTVDILRWTPARVQDKRQRKFIAQRSLRNSILGERDDK